MKLTRYTVGTPEDREEIVDFANYVFSQAHRPHDFKTLLPKAYGDSLPELGAKHFLAKQEGRIRALIALRSMRMRVPDDMLTVGCVGTVSVHPYSRGEGHMKHLMGLLLEDAREQGCDLLMLGGNRQRYNYFGFEQAGWVYRYNITASSVRHALSAVDAGGVSFSTLAADRQEEVNFAFALAESQPVSLDRPREYFLDIMHSWDSSFRLIRINDAMAGYVMGESDEIVLAREEDLPRVIKALYNINGSDHLTVACGPHQKHRMELLGKICSSRSIENVEMIHVLNWCHTLEAMLKLRASFLPLEDGEFSLAVGETPSITIRVKNGRPTATEEGMEPDLCLSHLEMERALFGLEAFSMGSPYKNWFPLPFFVSPADTF